jgi:aryl-alcohol dehydrogenase-like predicted oxidoreductase
MVWSPLAGGLLSGKYDRDGKGPEGSRRATFDFPPVDKDRAWKCIDAMRVIGKTHDVSVARVALAYVLHKSFVTTVIIGAKTIEQLDDNIAATKLHLSAEEMKVLDDVSTMPAEYPRWMLDRQGMERRPEPK